MGLAIFCRRSQLAWMIEEEDISVGLERLAKATGSYKAAALTLGISRQDIWRYRNGHSAPRPALMRRIRKQLPPPERIAERAAEKEMFAGLDSESVTKLKHYLLHLLHLLDLDGGARSGTERKGG